MREFLISAGSFVLGAAVTLVLGRAAQPHLDVRDELLACEIGNAGTTLQALTAFREGRRDDGLVRLEDGLSTNAVVLDEWLRELQPADPSTPENLIRAIAAYRSNHPHASGSREADRTVESALARHAVE